MTATPQRPRKSGPTPLVDDLLLGSVADANEPIWPSWDGIADAVPSSADRVLMAQLASAPGPKRKTRGPRLAGGGPAMFAGATYQSRVVAFIAAHVLAESPLGWIDTRKDVPIAVWAESGGIGDDALVETIDGRPYLEVQIKHGLTAGGALTNAATEMIARGASKEREAPVVLVVDQNSSGRLRRVAWDLDRIRSGRTDRLVEETLQLRGSLDEAAWFLERLHIVTCDVDRPADGHTRVAIDKLERALADPAQATSAWKVLIEDAAEIAARRERRDRNYLVGLLQAAGIEVHGLGENARWHQQLDFSKLLLERRQFDAALKHVDDLEHELGARGEARVWYRLHVQRASALFQIDRLDEADKSARSALDFTAEGVHALALLVRISKASGRAAEARRYAERAILMHPDDPIAWVAALETRENPLEDLPDIPLAVMASRLFRLARCEFALRAMQWQRVVELSGDLLGEGGREPELLLMRAQALHNTAEEGAVDADSRWRDSIRLASELIEDIHDDANPLTSRGLIVRAMARARIDELAEAEIDLTRAAQRAPNDVEIIRLLATCRVLRDDRKGGLRALQHPAAQREPLLIAMRAELHALAGDAAAANEDLDTAEGLLSEDDPSTDAVVRLALAALQLGQVERAQRLTRGVSVASGLAPIARGRLAVAQGRFDEARAEFDAAARLSPNMRIDLLTAFASELAHAGQPKRAIAVFDEVGTSLPRSALPIFVRALMKANDLVRAGELVKVALGEPEPAGWAIDAAARLALRAADPAAAAAHLAALDARGDLAVDGRIRLTLCLLQSGQHEQTAQHLEELISAPDLSAVQQMETAELLRMAGRAVEALPLAYRAARRAPADADIQRAFAGLVLTGGVPGSTPTVVERDTHVILRNGTGATRQYTVLSEPPIDASRGEISIEDAAQRGLIGMSIGDVQIDHPGQGYLEERWTVVSIMPAVAYAAQDVASRFHERFANERFFVRSFQFSDSALTGYLPFIQAMEQHKKHVTDVLALYRSNVLPLGALSKLLQASVAVVMDSISVDPLAGPLFTEWVDRAGQIRSRAAAAAATKVILTRSALHTARTLGLLHLLAGTYALVVPTSLHLELLEELQDAEAEVRHGRKVMMPDQTVGFTLDEREAQDPQLVLRRDAVKELIDYVSRDVEVRPRPLAFVGPPGSDDEKAREWLGASSHDALAIAQELGAVMYADDLGLRRLSSVPSFSTIALLGALADLHVISDRARDEGLRDLALRRYATVLPTVEILSASLSQPQQRFENVLELLAAPAVAIAEAAAIGAELIWSAAVGAIIVRAPSDVARSVLHAMSRSWPAGHAAVALHRAAEGRLRLLRSADIDDVRKVCADVFSKSIELRT